MLLLHICHYVKPVNREFSYKEYVIMSKVPIKNKFRSRPVPKGQIQDAIEKTLSMRQAAKYIGVSYNTFKKYAKMHDVFVPVSGKGIPHDTVPVWGLKIKDLLDGEHPNYPHWKLQEKLIKHGYLIEKCQNCDESRLRENDLKGPVLLDYLDNDQTNRNIDNLRLLCFNCYFLLKKDTEPNMKNLPLTKSSLKIHKAFGVEPPSPPEAVVPAPPAARIDPGSIGIEDIEQWISEESS